MEKILQIKSDNIYVIPCLFIRDKSEIKQLLVSDILFFEAENAYTRIITRNPKECYLSSQNLGKIESKLNFPCLCRVHRSYIVNLNYINAIVDNGLKINQYYIPIGKSYRHIMNTFIFI
ncbi:MAG: LytTR family transcriptional regulator [Bacteroidales bacterium]|jgi:DNA-binding LytR/AlgR family response regulator|nr:LytTR family transcriptional regulator [Bacteroidales bacterium]